MRNHLLASLTTAVTLIAGAAAIGQENPYPVERNFPEYFLEHRKLMTEDAGTYKAGDHPVWTVHVPDQWYGNSIFIEGRDGVIVYDTSISLEGGQHIAAEIKKVTDKPIKAIFYSHHHPDHYNGAAALVLADEVASGEVQIYAWGNFPEERANEFGALLPRQTMGIVYYSGAALPEEDLHYHSCCGVKVAGTPGYIAPTDLITEQTEMTIAGVELVVFYTGGEAVSEFGLYLPEYDMVIIADEFFYSLANVHSIRTSKPRDPERYMPALDKVREIEPEWLLGTHIKPIQGKEEIKEYVTKSRDAIQYFWDQSVRLINKGYTPVELQHALNEVPDFLDVEPYTRPMYGHPLTMVPEFYTGWVSWFDGDAVNLFPTRPEVKSARFVELMGGRDKVLAAAEKAFDEDDAQYAAELASMLISMNKEDMQARYLKASALRQIGYGHMNSIIRSWYLTGALELEGKIDAEAIVQAGMESLGGEMSAPQIITSWRYLVDPERTGDASVALGFIITDTRETVMAELRHSILEVKHDRLPDAPTAIVELSTETLRKIHVGEMSFAEAVNAGEAQIGGDGAAPDLLVSVLDRSVPNIQMHLR